MKMRKLFSLQYLAMCFMLEYLFLQGTTPLTLGSFESVSEATCEYEDANLIWRNKPAYSLNDVKTMAWYKGKDILLATWEGKGFTEHPPYVGRLMQIGATGIKLKTANRSDSGSYLLSLTLASTDHDLEAVTHLEVIVAPSSQCKPIITEEGSILKAHLPSEGCGTPPLSPKWKNTSKTVIQESETSSRLDLGRNFVSGEYIVCAEGDSAICYHGNISDLCSGLTKLQHERRDDELTSDPVSIIVPIVLVTLIATAITILAVIWWKRKLSRENRQSEQICLATESRPTDNAEACPPNEEYPLIERDEPSVEAEACTQDEESTLIGKYLPSIQNYLRGLYKSMTSVSVSPTGKDRFVDVSEAYIDLDFQQMETRDSKYREHVQAWTSYNTSASKDDIPTVEEHRQHNSPIIIIGCSGSGKSTWCKHIVQCWSQNFTIQDANVQGEYEILLYLQLKSSDRGLSFQELLRHYLFQRQPEYLNIITKDICDKSHAMSTLILIDGFDKICENEKPMSELLDHKLFSSCTVVFTCRPNSFNPIVDATNDSSIQLKLLKVCEMTLEKSKTYVSKVLSRLPVSQQNKDFNIKNFLIFTRNLNVQSLLKLPYLCLTLLFVWIENKNPYIEITDILLQIMEYLLDTEKTDQRCKDKMMKLSHANSTKVHTGVTKLDQRFVQIKDLMYAFSMTTEEIFLSETKGLTDEEWLARGTPARGKDTLCIEVLHDIGLVTESLSLKSNESRSTLTFTNVLIYQFFLSMAMAFKKGHAFDYIVSDMEVALKNSMIIHMLWQLSPTLGKKICYNICKLKSNKLEHLGKQNDEFRCSITNNYRQVKWLRLFMNTGGLDDDKLLFLTNALRSMDLLTSLVLEDITNNDDLVFWLPCSPTLKKLALNINNCTLLLCPEWNSRIPVKLKEVVIKSVIISSRDLELFNKSFKSCKLIEKLEIFPTVLNTGDNEISS